MTRQLHVAIVGGGMGGLAAAASLRHRGIRVSVYEQSAELREVGAGIFIYPNSLRQMERMGLGEALARVGAKVGSGSEYYRMDGSVVGKILTTDSSGWNGMYGMHRADILKTLADSLPASVIHTGHKCVDFAQHESGARVSFENGHVAHADVVIAADGINSVLQKYVVGPSAPEYAGFRAYRGLVAADKVPEWRREAHQVWMGDGKHFMVFPVRSGELLNYVGFVPTANQTIESWSAVGDRDELAASFAGWDPRVTCLLDKVESCFWWGLFDRRPLGKWVNGRLALLGDAAHPMLPHLGQGANQAIEDGTALAVILQACERGLSVQDALTRYEALRRPRTSMVQSEARKNGMRYDSQYADLAQRDKEIANSAQLRRSLYDYDIEKETLQFLNLDGVAA
ncbi:FAD-dependent monooxygenase [Hydrogenophaga sp. SNF1]|uniref:FAD-dependent monooxygenase n=1 Tax=Hydrogenophaga sp. SNF1 TaxID=3098762 RepID=UPI002ACC2D82|nr:FAD-dependent monooxygenase [Hydrogenophaga sp. SNF1]WQB84716.1 FAD-dependent monooxygenase [Hydrogenophaga sp. SNF1]